MGRKRIISQVKVIFFHNIDEGHENGIQVVIDMSQFTLIISITYPYQKLEAGQNKHKSKNDLKALPRNANPMQIT